MDHLTTNEYCAVHSTDSSFPKKKKIIYIYWMAVEVNSGYKWWNTSMGIHIFNKFSIISEFFFKKKQIVEYTGYFYSVFGLESDHMRNHLMQHMVIWFCEE